MARPPSPSPALALLLLALLCTTPGLGAPGGPCGVPPPAWCQSWETALRCGALGHCARHAWAPPTTDTCADCQQIVTILIRMANESATKVAVEGFLRRECAALPVPTMVPPCQNLVHEYFGLLLTDLVSGHPWVLRGHHKPLAICARLELCPEEPGGAPALPLLGALGTHLQVPAGQALPVPLPLCWLCRTFVARAEAAVPTEAVARGAAALCRALPVAVAGACQCLAQRYAVLALEGVLGRLGPRLLCRLLFVCRSEDADGPLAPPPSPLGATAAPLAAWAGAEDMGPGHPLPALSPNPGPCALGPPYWCSSPEAARRCQALQHCQEHVWM
ncbi:pulmonary surfactant-associated protein B [Nyctibius grandis]|uniref:pulmonary surfactant-associated protein B n=1 Tax=Nyctibius grandis TaxID=48427 RepID=UPI0035BBA6BB